MHKALARLRAKTDRELGILAEKQLEQAAQLVDGGCYIAASRSYHTVRSLLVVAELPAAQRARLERRLDSLRAALEQPASAVA